MGQGWILWQWIRKFILKLEDTIKRDDTHHIFIKQIIKICDKLTFTVELRTIWIFCATEPEIEISCI